MNYCWQEGDVAAFAGGEIYRKMGDKVRAREWLEKAVASSEEIMDREVEE